MVHENTFFRNAACIRCRLAMLKYGDGVVGGDAVLLRHRSRPMVGLSSSAFTWASFAVAAFAVAALARLCVPLGAIDPVGDGDSCG